MATATTDRPMPVADQQYAVAEPPLYPQSDYSSTNHSLYYQSHTPLPTPSPYYSPVYNSEHDYSRSPRSAFVHARRSHLHRASSMDDSPASNQYSGTTYTPSYNYDSYRYSSPSPYSLRYPPSRDDWVYPYESPSRRPDPRPRPRLNSPRYSSDGTVGTASIQKSFRQIPPGYSLKNWDPIEEPILSPPRSQTVRPSAQQARAKPPTTPKATEADAHRHRIPPGYSLKNWDPNEQPILLLGSVFDANNLGKWIYDWTVYRDGPATPIADMAGELWLLLIQLAGKLKRAEEGRPTDLKNNYSVSGLMDVAKGSINSKELDALVDSGASLNTISSSLVKELGIAMTDQVQREITVGSGGKIKSIGSVEVPWRFNGEETVHVITCAVMPNHSTSLMLGLPFLRLTQTLSRFKHRVRQILRPGCSKITNSFSFNLVGDSQERFFGYLNEEPVLAVPDSASDAMFISESYARQKGLDICRGPRNRHEVEFYDGSRACTTGIIKGVRWRFRETESSIDCDFYVLKDLPVDIILSNKFLHTFDVFSSYEDCLVDASFYHELEIFGISLIGKYCEELRDLEAEYQQDLRSPNPFRPDMIRKESARRSEIRQKIKKLPQAEQNSAMRDEEERQRQWQELWQIHRTTFISGSTTIASTPALVPLTVANNHQGAPAAPAQKQRLRVPLLSFRLPWTLKRL